MAKEEIKQDSVPESLKDGTVETKVTNLKTVIENKLTQLQDLATLEVMMPVEARLRDRMKSIKQMASARSIKIEGEWHTSPPKFHIRKLSRLKRNNDEGEISFEVYEDDGEGNKKLHVQTQEVTLRDGTKMDREIAAEYRIAYKVKEKIKTGKPIQREVMKMERK